MKKLRQLMLTAVIIGSVLTTATAAESFSVLLQKGIFAEETEGNLDAAIKIYQQITAEGATNRSVAAQAQYRLGVCYQKKGSKDQAVAALRQLITAFPNEGALNEKAQALLRELGYVPGENIVIRRLSLSGIWPSSLSPDGRWISHMQNDYKDLAVFDTLSGESRTVVKGTAEQTAPDYCIFSPDGQQVAYSWDWATNLYVTDIESPAPKCIYHAEKGWSVWPNDWLADGRSLVVTLNHPTIAIRIGLLSIGSQAFREVAAIPRPDSLKDLSLKASGDLLAFQRSSTNEEKAGIYVLSVQTGSQTKVSGSSRDDLVGWAPAADKLVFISDVAGAKRLWTLEFVGGKPVRDPELIKANVGGSIYPLGISTNGAIYYIARDVFMDVYLAEVDFETGKVANPPKRATQQFHGINTHPIWSHDGRKLGFIRLSASGATLADCFSVLELKTGEQRDFSLAGKFISPIQGMDWSHDETFLLLRAYRTDADDGIYRFDLQAGKAEPLLTQKRPQAGGDWYSNPRFSPDGKSFYYGRRRFFKEDKWSDSICRRHLGTGQNELVYESAESLDMWACPSDVSPDGKELAIVTYDGRTIKIVPVGRGDVRTLVTVPPPVELSEPRWTRDGRRVVFLKAPKENATELWRIAAAGGDATRIDLQLSPVCNFSLSPDGRRIALQAGPRYGPHSWITPEVWVMENALPRRVTAAK